MAFSTSAVAVCCWSDSESSSRAGLHLIEQSNVFDCDHRLIGEGLQQGDLFIAETDGLRYGEG